MAEVDVARRVDPVKESSADDDIAKSLGGLLLSEGKTNFNFDDLEILQTLGTGTFGRVHLTRHKSDHNTYYALKILKKSEVVRLKQVEHVNSERVILYQMKNPFVVTLYQTFQTNGTISMLLDYICGGELFSHLRRAGRFTTEVSRFYAAEIVAALEYLHSLDIVYRDLKPENILLDSTGHVKVTDFGFAKKIVDRTWTLCGTPEYLAPEIIQSKGHGKAVDWWALGILIFEMIAGYPPFFDEHPFGIYEKILAGKIHFPSHFDASAKDLVKKLLTADRTRRLGNLKNGAEDIKTHKFFKPLDWDDVYHCRLSPPIVPEISHAGDTQNFEVYPEPRAETEVREDPYAQFFKDF